MATASKKQSARHKERIATAPDDALTQLEEVRRFRNLRRIGIGLVALIVLAASTGVLGQRNATVHATGGGYRLSVLFPSVIRPGTDLRFEITVTDANGFGRSLTLAFDRHYFDLLDVNSLRPDPDSSTSDATRLIYTWNEPPGTAFHLSFDTTGEYGEHLGLHGTTSVLSNGQPVVTARYYTRWEP